MKKSIVVAGLILPSHDMTGGGLGLVDTWSQTLIRPPSAEALGELHSLHDDYGWAIYPEGF